MTMTKILRPVFHLADYTFFCPLFHTDTAVHYFICLIRSGAHVIQTQMMSTHDAMVRDSLDFPNLIKLSDVRQNFKYDLEIYGMVGFNLLVIFSNMILKYKVRSKKNIFFESDLFDWLSTMAGCSLEVLK